jgi:hypothetical protein
MEAEMDHYIIEAGFVGRSGEENIKIENMR